jgi:hypothetical protein
MSDSPLSPQDIRAAAEVHRELGPQYSEAVVASFLEKIDQEIEARIEKRVAALPQTRRHQPGAATLSRRRTFLAGAAVGVVGAGVPLTMLFLDVSRSYGGPDQGPLEAIWIVIGLIFIAAVLGVTGAVTVRIRRPGRADPAKR